MKLDHQADAGPDRLAHRRDDLDRGIGLRRIEHLPGGPERVELECAIALRHGRRAPLGKIGRRARPAVPAVGIRRDALVTPAAQQPVNRLTARLADQVPAGDLDPLIAVMTVEPPWYWSRIMPPITASTSNGSRPSTRPSTHSWSRV